MCLSWRAEAPLHWTPSEVPLETLRQDKQCHIAPHENITETGLITETNNKIIAGSQYQWSTAVDWLERKLVLAAQSICVSSSGMNRSITFGYTTEKMWPFLPRAGRDPLHIRKLEYWTVCVVLWKLWGNLIGEQGTICTNLSLKQNGSYFKWWYEKD